MAERARVADHSAEKVFARRVTISIEHLGLRAALDSIGQRAGVRFLYRWALLDAVAKPVTVTAQDAMLGTVLDRVLTGTGLRAVSLANDLVAIRTLDAASDALTGIVSGVVTDAATKRPVAGAAVTIEGTKFTAQTADDGAYRVMGVPAGTYTIVVRRLGFRIERRPAKVDDNGMLTINVPLTAASTVLEEVVTTMTGAQRRVELGHVVSVIKADSLVKEAPITSVSQLLTSRVPGLVVTQGQGTVGGSIRLQIRSASSLSLSTEPIVIVDGIRYTSRAGLGGDGRESVSPLNDLNPNDIETVEVVKGPSAATLYGTDASDGVIIITTKRGKVGPARWNAFTTRMRDEIPRPGGQIDDVYYGYGTLTFGTRTFNTDHCDLGSRARSPGRCALDSLVIKKATTSGSHFSILRPSQSWTSGASVSGGPQSIRYYFSGTYNDQTAAFSTPDTVLKLLRARGKGKLPESFTRPNGQTLLNLLSNVTATVGPAVELGVRGGYTRGNTQSVDKSFAPLRSSLGNVDDPNQLLTDALNAFSRQSTERNDRYVGGGNGITRLASWLTARASVGMDRSTRDLYELHPRDSLRSEDRTGRVVEGRYSQTGTSADGGLTASMRMGPLTLRTSAGTQYTRSEYDAMLAIGTDLPEGASSMSFALSRSVNSNHDESVTLGSYLEEMLGLNERLFLTAAVRVDGASGFGTGYDAAVYPKFGASWRISHEPFFPTVPGVDELRLRASFGVSGRQAAPEWSLPYLDLTPGVPGQPEQAISFIMLGNARLRPERGREVETGVDADLFNQRLQLQTTWFKRRTADQIIGIDDAPGFTWKRTNVGLVTGQGFEGQVTAQLLDTRPFSLAATLTHSTQGTTVVELGDALPWKSDYGGYVEGYPIGARFIQRLINYSDADGDGFLERNELQYSDTLQYAGVNEPTRTQTLSLNAGLFQQWLRLSALFDRRGGYTLLNSDVGCDRCRENFDSTVSMADRAAYLAKNPWQSMTVTATRLREVTAAVTFPARFARALRVASGSLSLTARNLAQWTNFKTNDPESVPLGLSGAAERFTATGIPQSRTWMFRVDLGL